MADEYALYNTACSPRYENVSDLGVPAHSRLCTLHNAKLYTIYVLSGTVSRAKSMTIRAGSAGASERAADACSKAVAGDGF